MRNILILILSIISFVSANALTTNRPWANFDYVTSLRPTNKFIVLDPSAYGGAGQAPLDVVLSYIVSTGTAAPTSSPLHVGQIYVDSKNSNVYVATGTNSTSDWLLTFPDTKQLSTLTNTVIYNATVNYGTAANAFGDSITAGGAPTYASNALANVITAKKGWTLVNQAIAAKELADLIELRFYTNIITSNSISFALLGYNDMRQYGNNATDIANFKSGLMSASVFLTIPRDKLITAQSTSVSYAGNWVATPVYGGTLGQYTTEGGATATFTLHGPVIYIDVLKQNSASGNRAWNVKIDGVDYGNFATNDFRPTVAYVTHIPCLIRISNLEDKDHLVVLTTTGTSGNAYFNWAATASSASQSMPEFYLGNCLRMNSAGYLLGGSPWVNGSDAAVAAFNVAIEDVVRTLSNDGLNIAYIDACSRYNLLTDISGDGVHPNDSGHLHIADAFLSVMNSRNVAGRGLKRPTGASFTEDVITSSNTTNRHVFQSGIMVSNITNFHQ